MLALAADLVIASETARYVDVFGKQALIEYWRELGEQYYASRVARWRAEGVKGIAADWQAYFADEPQAKVEITTRDQAVEMDVQVCPAIKHLRESGRDIVPEYCEHCDHTCGAMAQAAGFAFERTGGMGSCVQRFTPVTIQAR